MIKSKEIFVRILTLLACSSLISGELRKKRQDDGSGAAAAGIDLGPLKEYAHGCRASKVLVINEVTIQLVNHSYGDPKEGDVGPNAWYVLSKTADAHKERNMNPRPVAVCHQKEKGFV